MTQAAISLMSSTVRDQLLLYNFLLSRLFFFLLDLIVYLYFLIYLLKLHRILLLIHLILGYLNRKNQLFVRLMCYLDNIFLRLRLCLFLFQYYYQEAIFVIDCFFLYQLFWQLFLWNYFYLLLYFYFIIFKAAVFRFTLTLWTI